MVADKNHLTGLVTLPQHIRVVADKWAKVGKADVIAVTLCFGVPPAAILISSIPIPDEVSEADYIGALLGEPLSVVKSETNDLPVPADSEIVMDCTLNLNDTRAEGGEMHGYCFPGQSIKCPTYQVNCICYRNDAIMPISKHGLCTDETHTLIGGLTSAEVLSICLKKNLPVLDVFTPYEA